MRNRTAFAVLTYCLVAALITGSTPATAAERITLPTPTPGEGAFEQTTVPPHAWERLPEQAAARAGLPAAPNGKAWFLVLQEQRTDTVDDGAGKAVTTTGTYSEYALASPSEAPAAAKDSSALTMATLASTGCQVSTYWSVPYRVYLSSPYNKYGPRAHAWEEMSGTECPSFDWFYLEMYEDHGVWKPRVASTNGYVYPGKGRKTIYATYTGIGKCESYASHSFGDYSKYYRICP